MLMSGTNFPIQTHSVDPDQTALGAVWSGFTLFATDILKGQADDMADNFQMRLLKILHFQVKDIEVTFFQLI